jgi:hypothetical protein
LLGKAVIAWIWYGLPITRVVGRTGSRPQPSRSGIAGEPAQVLVHVVVVDTVALEDEEFDFPTSWKPRTSQPVLGGDVLGKQFELPQAADFGHQHEQLEAAGRVTGDDVLDLLDGSVVDRLALATRSVVAPIQIGGPGSWPGGGPSTPCSRSLCRASAHTCRIVAICRRKRVTRCSSVAPNTA